MADEVCLWLEQLTNGDHDGARHLWRHFGPRMLAVARAWNRQWQRFGLAEPEDIVQAGFASFCLRALRGALGRIETSAAVWRVLKTVVTRAAIRMTRDARCAKRGGGVQRERTGPMDIPALGRDPTTEAAGVEEFLLTLDRLAVSDEELWRVALWKMQGLTNNDISAAPGVSVATVERRLRAIKQALNTPPRRIQL